MTPEEAAALKEMIEGAALDNKRLFFHVFDEIRKMEFLWNGKNKKPTLTPSVSKAEES